MSIPGAASPLFLATTAGAAAGFEISRSLRFNSGDSAYLNRTPSSAGNRKKFTWSGWIKKYGVGTQSFILAAGTSSDEYVQVYFSTDQIVINTKVSGQSFTSTKTGALYRDPASWFHLIIAIDTTATGNSGKDRLKLYVNGNLLDDSFYSTDGRANIAVNSDLAVNATVAHYIGKQGVANTYANASLAEVNFIDGSALDASSFGETDANGVWRPIDTAGLTFGTNGFRLKFADNSSNAALGTDSSGNSNTFTVNNLTAAAPGLATANQGFDVVAYTGDGNTGRSISSLSFSPDLVWFKNRGTANYHQWHDRVRGPLKRIYSNSSDAENNYTTALTSFDSNGWTMGNGTPCNASGNNYVAWCWKAGGAASSNTDGSVTSSVSASNTYGFSIVSFTDGGSACTIGHGLNSAPKWILVKFRGASGNWSVYHESIGNDHRLKLNLTDAKQSGNDWWNATSPTSSVFSLGSNLVTSTTQIAYCWSEIAGFSKFSSYSGNNGTQTIDCGFSPAVVLIKCTTSANNWIIQDSARGIEVLYPNTNDTEFGGNYVSLTDTGFTLNTSSSLTNSSGQTYIYAAFAAKPDQSVIDSLVDTPTNGDQTDTGAGGEVVGNYATFNPLNSNTHSAYYTLSNGNLKCVAVGGSSQSGGSRGFCVSTIGMSSGKYYFELTVDLNDNNDHAVGIAKATGTGYYSTAGNWTYQASGNKFANSGSGASYGASYTAGDIIGVAFDADTGALVCYKNGSSQGTLATVATGETYFFVWGTDAGSAQDYEVSANFGQRAFAYPLSGYKSLNTANLPTPTIADGSKYFDTKLFTGTGSTLALTMANSELSPDFVWIKNRNSTYQHLLFDAVRGATKYLKSDADSAEQTNGSTLASFDSNGFTLGGDNEINRSSYTYASWVWDAGTSTVTNNDGSIASQVRASAASGFSIIKYTGNNTSGATVGHGLNAAPEFAIFRQIAVSNDWSVYSKAAGATGYLRLNLTDAFTTTSGQFNNTDPNSSVITLGGDHNVNGPSNEIICYAFAPVEGYSAMGSFEGNSSADGAFCFTGFKPALVVCKNIDAGQAWQVYDSARGPFNVIDEGLQWNSSGAEYTGTDRIDFLSNGFKIKAPGGAEPNVNGQTYIYLSFASNPFASNGGLAR